MQGSKRPIKLDKGEREVDSEKMNFKSAINKYMKEHIPYCRNES